MTHSTRDFEDSGTLCFDNYLTLDECDVWQRGTQYKVICNVQ